MASHGGDDEGFRTQRFYLLNEFLGNEGDVGNAPASTGNADALAGLDIALNSRLQQSIVYHLNDLFFRKLIMRGSTASLAQTAAVSHL